jgi:hypothetical protein
MEEKLVKVTTLDNGLFKIKSNEKTIVKIGQKYKVISPIIPYCDICNASNVGLANFNEFMFYGNVLIPK